MPIHTYHNTHQYSNDDTLNLRVRFNSDIDNLTSQKYYDDPLEPLPFNDSTSTAKRKHNPSPSYCYYTPTLYSSYIENHPTKKTKVKGKGFFQDIGKFFKKSKLLSTVTKYIPVAGPVISDVLKTNGLGKMKSWSRVRRSKGGRSKNFKRVINCF